jgi:D-aminopeptidase
MRVFIAVDMEGIAGLVQWDSSQGDLQRRLMTEQVNAAARGALAGNHLPKAFERFNALLFLAPAVR